MEQERRHVKVQDVHMVHEEIFGCTFLQLALVPLLESSPVPFRVAYIRATVM